MRHTFASPITDAGNADEVGPDEWNAAHTTPVVTVSGTTHTTATTDAGKLLRCTSSSATTVTVDNLAVGDDVLILQAGTGTLTVAAGSGWALVSRGSVFGLAGQWAMASVYVDATDHAVLSGDIA